MVSYTELDTGTNRVAVRPAMVVPVQDERTGSAVDIRAVVSADCSREELFAWCRSRLPKYMVPVIEVRPQLPTSAAGKLDRLAVLGTARSC